MQVGKMQISAMRLVTVRSRVPSVKVQRSMKERIKVFDGRHKETEVKVEF